MGNPFNAIDTYRGRTEGIVDAVGIIQSINGNVCYVRFNGSGSIVQCRINPTLQATAGDECYMIRSLQSQSSDWIVISSWNARGGNISNGLAVNPQHTLGAAKSTNIGTFIDSNVSVDCNNVNYIEAFSLKFLARSDTVLLQFDGYSLYTVAATTIVGLKITIYVDGVDAFTTYPIYRVGRLTADYIPVSFTIPVKGVTPGLRTFSIMASQTSVANSAKHALVLISYNVMDF